MRKPTCNILKNRTIFSILIFSLSLLLIIFLIEIAEITKYHPVKTIHKNIQKHVQKVFGQVLPSEKKTQIDLKVIYGEVSKELENLPVEYLYDRVVVNKSLLEYNTTCAKIPKLEDLKFENINWHILDIPDEGHMELFSAYYDNRPDNPLSTIRILGMVIQEIVIDDNLVFPEVYCQIWSDNSNKPILTKVFNVDYVWRDYWGKPRKGTYHPYMMTCVLPEDYLDTPKAVSLVRRPCDGATNLLKVNYNPRKLETEENYKICVCTKAISEMEDKSLELVEWLEWLKRVGVNYIDFKVLHVHEEMQKVLDYYSQDGFLSYTKMYLPGDGPNTPYLQYLHQNSAKYNAQFDLIAYNDCLLKQMHRYDFVIPLELNEILMIKGDYRSIQDVLLTVPENKDAYALQRIPFIGELADSPDVPRLFTFMKNNYKLNPTQESPNNMKCLFNTKTMLMIHHHYPFESLKGIVTLHDIEEKNAVVEMHLKNCPEICRPRKQVDNAKLRFKDDVIMNAGQTFKDLSYV